MWTRMDNGFMVLEICTCHIELSTSKLSNRQLQARILHSLVMNRP
jgi:hypothetical protein